MSTLYFSQFPQIIYDGKRTINITERVALDKSYDPRSFPTIYNPYEIHNELRADVVATHYYDDPNLDWLIYLANGMTDPYYDWFLAEDDFNRYIIEKYGSIEFAQQLISHYVVNWADFDIALSTEYYAALPEVLRKYYIPRWDAKHNIVGYKRREEDWVVSTNVILEIDISISNDKEYSNNEIIEFYQSANRSGAAQVVSGNSTVLFVQHVSGNTGSGNTIVGTISNAHSTITATTIRSQPLSNAEAVFWQPVYFYDLERERNQRNQSIFLLDANQTLPVLNSIRNRLAE